MRLITPRISSACQSKEKQPKLSYHHSEFEHVTVRNLVFARLHRVRRRHACLLWPPAGGEHHSLFVLPVSYRNVIRGTRSGLPLRLALPQLHPS